MAHSKFLDPKNDVAFKRIFGSERNKNILIHFLNDTFWPWNSTVRTDLDIYTGFIPTQLMTNNSGCCYSL